MGQEILHSRHNMTIGSPLSCTVMHADESPTSNQHPSTTANRLCALTTQCLRSQTRRSGWECDGSALVFGPGDWPLVCSYCRFRSLFQSNSSCSVELFQLISKTGGSGSEHVTRHIRNFDKSEKIQSRSKTVSRSTAAAAGAYWRSVLCVPAAAIVIIISCNKKLWYS